MAQLIDKSALVAEIESKIKKYTKRGEESDAKRDGCGMYWGGVLSCLNEVRTLCDTLEVKEVDLEHLEQEVKDFCYKFDNRKDKWYEMTPHDKNIITNPTWSNFAMQLAKHFFELGLKAAQKGEEV